MSMMNDPGQMTRMELWTKNGTTEVVVYEDMAIVPQGRVGVFGWANDPRTNTKIGAAYDWPKDEAPMFLDQCNFVLDDIKEKLNEHSA